MKKTPTEKLIRKIAAFRMLRIEQWRAEFGLKSDPGAWRAGIEWYREGEYEFICEYKTLAQCVQKIDWYLREKYPEYE